MLKRSLVLAAVFATVLAAASAQKAEAADASVKVVNRSSYTIYSINVSPVYRRRYGNQDLLGSVSLKPNYHIWIDFDVSDAENECRLDVRAKGPVSTGLTWETRINVCTESEWTIYDK